MSGGYEGHAVDYAADWEEHIFTRATPEAQMAFEAELERREARARQAWRSLPQDEVARFRAAGQAVRRLRQEGKDVRDIMAAFNLRDPASVRRMEAVLDWLEVAGSEPRAALLAGLTKRTFLAVVSRGILTVDDLAARAGDLARLPAFQQNDSMSEIRMLVTEAGTGQATPQQ